jgi:tetraacyldisaccharide 4'-kinase
VPDIFGSYIRYARGESSGLSPWAMLNVVGALSRPFIDARNAFYDRGVFPSMDPPLPVVSVGNLCNGGTNKTPMVEMLSRRLMSLGLSVGIVSRGYTGETTGAMWIGRDAASWDRSVTGDEPLMLASRLPDAKVVVSRDRHDGVRLLHELGADVAVADDAFQHRRMGRDLDMVLIDATCPFGNGRLFPAGILREHPDALLRADIVILTKVEQASAESVEGIRLQLSRWAPPESIFTSRVRLESWLEMSDGVLGAFDGEGGRTKPEGRFVAFSAIGNSHSFHRSLLDMGMDVAANRAYRDHHRFTWRDVDELERLAGAHGATGLICTEKDIQNMPENPCFLLPVYIPSIAVSIDEDDRFWRAVSQKLKPELVVTSNGYGEDSVGALLARRLRDRFPLARVSAFSLVGDGKEYRDRGIPVVSPPADMPSGGIVKYSVKALIGDVRHGLVGLMKRQIAAWRSMRGKFRTPICVGDVYLLAHTLWGQGLTPVLIATAKSVKLRGHWLAERLLMRERARRVWTRDAETAEDLGRTRIDAVFHGNPLMDLAVEFDAGSDPWRGLERPHIMLLPGSRPRAYEDAALLLDAVALMSQRVTCGYVLVLAPTLEKKPLFENVPYKFDGDGGLAVGLAKIFIYSGPLAPAARGADLLIGLGGTANQVSAGLGVPVLSIIERSKIVQKKLLRESEVLVAPKPDALAEAAMDLLSDPARREEMSQAGMRLLGGSGALDRVVEYAAANLGWDARCRLYGVLRKFCLEARDGRVSACGERVYEESEGRGDDENNGGEREAEWRMPENMIGRALKLVKIIKGQL